MFENIGNKIKTLAGLFCWIGIIASLFISFYMFFLASEAYSGEGGFYTFAGIAILSIGSIVSWIFSCLLYGFGQLVDNSDKLVSDKGLKETDNAEIK